MDHHHLRNGTLPSDESRDVVRLAALEPPISRELMLMEAGDQPFTADMWATRERLRAELGERYYARLLSVLTRRPYSAARAESIWARLRLHKEVLAAQLGRNPGMYVAALDYLMNHEAPQQPCATDEADGVAVIADEAARDPLTGLRDRSSFDRALDGRVEGALAGGQNLALLLVDLDLVDPDGRGAAHTLGAASAAPEPLLQRLARLLEREVRPPELLARYADSRMALLMPDATPADALRRAERLRNALTSELEGALVNVGVSVMPEAATTSEGLLRAAEQALDDCKRRGRSCSTLRASRPPRSGSEPPRRTDPAVALSAQDSLLRTRQLSAWVAESRFGRQDPQ